MKLFEIDELFQVQLNKEWILMIPEFKALFDRDKGSASDYRGSKKLRTRRELSYIYFMVDFHSPIRDYQEDKKQEEALRYAQLEKKDIDDKVKAALEQYSEMQIENAPSLRTLEAMKFGAKQLDAYFRDVNFEKVDKQGKAFYTAKEYITNIKELPKMRSAIKEFERMVEEELRENTGIRGKSKQGGQEGKRRDKPWQEGSDPDEITETETTEL